MRASLVLPVCVVLFLAAVPIMAADPVMAAANARSAAQSAAREVGVGPSDDTALMVLPDHARSRFLHVEATGPVRLDVDVTAGVHTGLTLRSSGLCKSVSLDDGASVGALASGFGEHFALDCGTLTAGWYQIWMSVTAGAASVNLSSPAGPVSSSLGNAYS